MFSAVSRESLGVKTNSNPGGEDDRAERDLVLWAAVHGQQGVSDLAEAEQECPCTGRDKTEVAF